MKVLIPVQDKHSGELVIDFVESHKWPDKVQFILIHVVEPVVIGHSVDLGLPIYQETITESARKSANEMMDSLAELLGEKVGAEKVDDNVLEGKAVDVILDVAEERNVDLIVTGSHGKGTMRRMVLGSVSLAILTHANCAVTVLRPPREEE